MEDRNIKKLWNRNQKRFIEEFSILQTINSDGKVEHTYFERTKNGELIRLSTCQIEEINCTGLKDKNGKLIYEGDIIEYQGGEFYQGYWEFTGQETIKNIMSLPLCFDYADIFVTGNIYENPELLEGKE